MQDQHSSPDTAPANAEETAKQPAAPATWESLGLSSQTLEQVKQAGYTQPSPVQAEAIPIVIDGQDLIASAQTGTGKTASFVLPMVEAFEGRQGTFGLILAPTREIAQQIEATIKLFGGPRGIRSAVLIGGIDMRHDVKALNDYPQIIVATPGRLCDHLDRGNVWLDYIEIVVLDEADRMLDMGFSDQLSRITSDLPKQRQTLLFSATITGTVRKLAEKILYQPKSVTIGKPLTAAKTVEQRLLWMKEESKNRELQRLLRREPGSIIVFTRSKDGATRVWRSLHSAGFYDATFIHSDRLQRDRELALAEFKEGKYRIMIATDVAARGLHIDGVSMVVNYDLPMEAEDYVHRIGRTGRAGATGKSQTFCTSRDRGIVREIEKLIGKPIQADYTDSFPREGTEGPLRDDHRRGDRPRGGDRGRGHGRSHAGPAQQQRQAGPEVGGEHAHQHTGARGPRAHGEGATRDANREHAPVAGAQGGGPADPNDPSRGKRRRRRRGGRGKGGTPGPGGEGGGGPASEGSPS